MDAGADHERVTSEVPDPETNERFDFPCENCGARMTWDPASDALACDYCEHRLEVPRADGTILERPLEEAGEAVRGLGLDLRVARCHNCGARVAFGEASTSEVCVYCGSASVLAQEANRNVLRPESLVPLDVGQEQVRENFQRWLRKLWFRPNAIRKTKRFDATGIYVPFWTFDCRVRSDWSADAGHYYWVTQTYMTTVNGKPRLRTRRVRKVRWVPAWGNRDDAFDDLLVLASRGLDQDQVDGLGGFDTRALVPYQPHYLAGWRAEEYQVDLPTGWERGQKRVIAVQEERCSSDVPGDTQRNLRVRNVIRDVRWKHALLPIWSLQYRFRGKVYTVLVNGQTGRVVGQAPYSWAKILALLVGILVAGGIVVSILGAS